MIWWDPWDPPENPFLLQGCSTDSFSVSSLLSKAYACILFWDSSMTKSTA